MPEIKIEKLKDLKLGIIVLGGSRERLRRSV
jgi:hypothetical protein